MHTLSMPDPSDPRPDRGSRPTYVGFLVRRGVRVPEPECVVGPHDRVSPVAFERWMIAMLDDRPSAVPVPYPGTWYTGLRFPYEDEPDLEAPKPKKKARRAAR